VTGGRRPDNGSTRTLFVYDPGTDSWARMADMPQASCGGAQGVIAGQLYVYTVLDGKLFVAGGAEDDAGVVGTLEVYDPVTNTWTIAAPMPTPRFDAAATAARGKLFVIGGGERIVQRSSKVDAYTP
jgi:N-acetylneuraminic acid mutarotase